MSMSVKVKKPGSEPTKIYTVEKIDKLPRKTLYMIEKRLFDIVIALAAIIVLLIPMLVISIMIVIDSPGNPIYSQVRLGLNEKAFVLYKFRSMRMDAEKHGIQWAETDDPRVTKLGRILRDYRLDELPQLWNILKGDMSFVGPRPERPEYYDLFDTYIVGFRQRMLVMPGLTGHAQINGGYNLLPEEKIIYDIEYIKKQSMKFDFKCIIGTVKTVLKREGAH